MSEENRSLRWLSRPLHSYVDFLRCEVKRSGERATDAARCACHDEDLVFLKDAIQRDKITHFTRFVFISVRVAAEGKVIAHFDDSTE